MIALGGGDVKAVDDRGLSGKAGEVVVTEDGIFRAASRKSAFEQTESNDVIRKPDLIDARDDLDPIWRLGNAGVA